MKLNPSESRKKLLVIPVLDVIMAFEILVLANEEKAIEFSSSVSFFETNFIGTKLRVREIGVKLPR